MTPEERIARLEAMVAALWFSADHPFGALCGLLAYLPDQEQPYVCPVCREPITIEDEDWSVDLKEARANILKHHADTCPVRTLVVTTQ